LSGARDEGLGGGGVEVVVSGELEVTGRGEEVLGQEHHRIAQLLGMLGSSGDVGAAELVFPLLCDRRDVHAVGKVHGESHLAPSDFMGRWRSADWRIRRLSNCDPLIMTVHCHPSSIRNAATADVDCGS
jgi:hypothetical protein